MAERCWTIWTCTVEGCPEVRYYAEGHVQPRCSRTRPVPNHPRSEPMARVDVVPKSRVVELEAALRKVELGPNKFDRRIARDALKDKRADS